jgi:protein MpaA
MILAGNIKSPKVLIIGCFHGDEPQGEYLINKYIEKYSDTKLLFIPRLNKKNTRVNNNGVDLNRNFPTKNWELTEKNEYYGGPSPASEKETIFIMDIVKKYQPQIILTLHAPYKIVNYDGPKSESNLNIIKKISNIMKYPIEESIGYPTPGSFGTWAGIEQQILTITLELDENIEVDELIKPISEVFEYLEGIN